MAMVVPTFTDVNQGQVKPDMSPSVRVSTSAPEGAFGGGAFADKAAAAGMQAAGAATDYMKEQKDRNDQLAHIQADTQASELQTNIQTDVSKMKGQDALEAPEYMQQKWQDGISKIQDGLTGQNQKMAFARTSAQRLQDLNKSVQMHVASEHEAFADQTYQSGMDQFRNQAVVNAGDDAQVLQAVDGQKQLMEGWAERKGVPLDSDIFKDKYTTETSATHLGVIHARLQAGMDDAAKEYFDAHKGTMSEHDLLNADNALDAAKVVSESQDLFDGVMSDRKQFMFSDGTVNGEKVRQYVMQNTEGMSDQRKTKVMGQVKAQIGEYNRDRYHSLAANERDFANEVVKGRSQGTTLGDAMKVAVKWGHDPYDTAEKMQFVQKTYETPSPTKTIIAENLREGIDNGVADVSDIKAAFDRGDLSADQYANLKQHHYKVAADGTDPTSKYYNGLIMSKAREQIGSDKQALADFSFALNTKTQGKNPEEKYVTAQEMLKPGKPEGLWQNIFGAPAAYKQEAKTDEEKANFYGTMNKDIGYKQVQAIANGMQGGGFDRIQNPEQHIANLGKELGVKYDQMKVGTPVNDAIQLLRSRGRLVNPDTVRAALKHLGHDPNKLGSP